METQKNDFFYKCEPIDENLYENIDSDRLVVYSVFLLEKNGTEPTFEKIVAIAFKLFPKRFSLLGFPEYPDARWIYYSLWHCVYRTKGWLSGSPKNGYHITPKGKEITSQLLEAFSGKVCAPRKVATKQERKEIHSLKLIEESSAFRKYLSQGMEHVKEMEIRIMLRARMDTPTSILKQNLKKYLEYAKVVNKPEIIEFLKKIEKSPKWAHLFGKMEVIE